LFWFYVEVVVLVQGRSCCIGSR